MFSFSTFPHMYKEYERARLPPKYTLENTLNQYSRNGRQFPCKLKYFLHIHDFCHLEKCAENRHLISPFVAIFPYIFLVFDSVFFTQKNVGTERK